MTRKLRSILVLVRATLIVGAIAWVLVHDVFPRLRESSAIERDIERATLEMSRRLQTLTQVRSLLEFEEGAFRSLNDKLLRAIPPEPQVSELYQDVTAAVTGMGLRLIGCTVGKEEKAPLLPQSSGIQTYRIPVEVEAAGKFRSLALLADHLADSPRLLAMQEVTMRRDETYLPDSVARLKLHAFYFEPPPDVATASEGR
jgi:Tfp pilus assembly protein PilO